MKDTLQLMAIVLATFLILFLTSLLLSWPWIMAHWARQALVIILLIVELFHGVLAYIEFGKMLKK